MGSPCTCQKAEQAERDLNGTTRSGEQGRLTPKPVMRTRRALGSMLSVAGTIGGMLLARCEKKEICLLGIQDELS